MADNTWVMPANLKIWAPEAPAGVAVRIADKTMRWSAVTTLADGQTTWHRDGVVRARRSKKGLTGMELRREESNEQGWLYGWPDNIRQTWPWSKAEEPERAAWRPAVELAGLTASHRRRNEEAREALVSQRERALAVQRQDRGLLRLTVKRLVEAVNEVKQDWAEETRTAMAKVTRHELGAAFREFLKDVEGDKGVEKPYNYKQWLWTDRNTVYLAPVGRRKTVGKGRVAG
jgi:hypothetical protein